MTRNRRSALERTSTNDMKTPKLLIVCPIGKDDSSERQRSDKLLKHVIHPAVKDLFPGSKAEEVIIRADQMSEPGKITTQILRELVSANCVIVDLTGTNANVMYELGIRQALAKPLVLMAEHGQALPFDLNDYRTIFYKLDLDHVESAQTELKKHITKALSGNLSAIDKALFERESGEVSKPVDERKELLSILEVCGSIAKDMADTKDYMLQVGNIVASLRDAAQIQIRAHEEKRNHELGMQVFTQMLQNPETMERAIPLLQKMAEMGASKADPVSSSEPKSVSQTSKRK
jgi:nucleoside 2-deoxyribosyltransferase